MYLAMYLPFVSSQNSAEEWNICMAINLHFSNTNSQLIQALHTTHQRRSSYNGTTIAFWPVLKCI